MKYVLLKKTFCLLLALLSSLGALWSQADVIRYSAVEYASQGIVYYLPKSLVKVSLTIEKMTYTPGEFSAYAPILFGKEISIQPQTSYQIKRVRLSSIGVPDEEQQYIVSFKASNPFSYVALTKEGVIAGINTDGVPSVGEKEALLTEGSVLPQNNLALPREYALATSKAKRAEIVAVKLFEMREDLLELISGKAENAPRDGVAYELAVSELKAQIAGLEALFEGATATTTIHRDFFISPEGAINNRTLARFSVQEGLLPANSTKGEPITFNLSPTRSLQELSPEEMEKRERKLKGIIYNAPGIAEVTLRLDRKVIAKEDLPITQLGYRVSLENQITKPKEGNVCVLFDVNTGAILSLYKKE